MKLNIHITNNSENPNSNTGLVGRCVCNKISHALNAYTVQYSTQCITRTVYNVRVLLYIIRIIKDCKTDGIFTQYEKIFGKHDM